MDVHLTSLSILPPLLGGIVLAGLLAVVLVNWFRPDLFRFEAVAVTTEPSVLSALDPRVAVLDRLTHAQLSELPEEQNERGRLDDHDVLFQTARTHLPDGGIEIVVVLVLRATPGLFARPLRVAARGFRAGADEFRTPLTDTQLVELAMGGSGQPFYDR